MQGAQNSDIHFLIRACRVKSISFSCSKEQVVIVQWLQDSRNLCCLWMSQALSPDQYLREVCADARELVIGSAPSTMKWIFDEITLKRR